MKKLIILGLIAPLCIGLTYASGDDRTSSHSTSITMNDDSPNDTCTEHMQLNQTEFRANIRDEETKTIPNQPLSIKGEENGGISVTTWDGPEFSIKLCKQVAAADEATARKLLAETHLDINGSQIGVNVPKEDDFVVATLIVIKAPRNATLDLHVQNGGISLNNFNGTAEAHAQNGGISFRHSTGKLTANAENGGISIKDCGGDVTADVENGGLSIALQNNWDGKGLEAHAANGGLVLSVPRTFNGGLEVAASRETALICKDEICNAGDRSVEGGHKVFRMGGTNPQIKASTDNGGIVIQERDHHRGDF
jgi:hypothetical protein